MAGIIPNLAGIMVGVGQNFPMSACEPTVHCTLKPLFLSKTQIKEKYEKLSHIGGESLQGSIIACFQDEDEVQSVR